MLAVSTFAKSAKSFFFSFITVYARADLKNARADLKTQNTSTFCQFPVFKKITHIGGTFTLLLICGNVLSSVNFSRLRLSHKEGLHSSLKRSRHFDNLRKLQDMEARLGHFFHGDPINSYFYLHNVITNE